MKPETVLALLLLTTFAWNLLSWHRHPGSRFFYLPASPAFGFILRVLAAWLFVTAASQLLSPLGGPAAALSTLLWPWAIPVCSILQFGYSLWRRHTHPA